MLGVASFALNGLADFGGHLGLPGAQSAGLRSEAHCRAIVASHLAAARAALASAAMLVAMGSSTPANAFANSAAGILPISGA